MSSRDPDASPVEIDPFAFPSDTTFRFVLLVLAVLGTSLFAFHSLAIGTRTDEISAVSLCVEQGRGTPDSCGSAGLRHALAASVLAAVCILLLVSLAVYLAMPGWKLRRRGLQPLSAADAPEVVARLAELSNEAGLRTPPRFVWNPLDRTGGGLAFGRVGRRYVALGGGLVVRHYTDPEVFRAIVLHELGHLRNRDVDKAYLTMALWYSFLGVAVLPLLVSLHDERLPHIWSIVWRLGALVVLVFLSRNAVLRARESYADLRASRDERGADALRGVIGAHTAPAASRWRRLLSVHPDPQARLAVLDDTDVLLRPGLAEAFGAGVMLTLTYAQLALLIAYVDAYLIYQYLLAAIAVVPVCAAVVTIGIWRGVFLRLVRPTAASRVWPVGVALGLGFLVGELLSLLTIETDGSSPYARATHLPKIEGVVSTAMFGSGVVWIVLALVSLMLFVLWTHAAAAIWLSRGGERLPRIAVVGGVLVGGAVLSVWTAMFFFAHDTAIPAAQAEAPIVRELYTQIANAIWVGPSSVFVFIWEPTGSVLGGYWFVIPAFAMLWAFPLAAAATRRAASWPSWAFLGVGRPGALHPHRLQVARAALIGLVAGLAAWAGTLLLRALIHVSLGASPPTDEFRLGVAHWEYVIAMVAQMLAAVAAVLLCRRSAVPHGLLAGFVAGAVAVAGLQVNTTIRSCITVFSLSARHVCPTLADGGIAHYDFDVVLARGALLALVASLGTFGIVWLVRRAREASRATGRASLSDLL